MLDMSAGQDVRQQLRDFDRGGTHQNGTTLFVQPQNLIDHSSIFLTFCLVNQVISINTDDRLIGRDHHHIQLVNIPKLARFRLSGTGHTGQLLVHAEVVLQRDGSVGLRGGLHLHIFLSLNSLVQTIGVTTALHDTTRLFIHNLHFVVDDDIFHIAVKHGVSLQQLMNRVDTVGGDGIIVIDFLFTSQFLSGIEVFFLQIRNFSTHIRHDEHFRLVSILTDKVDTFVHNIDGVELFLNHKVKLIIDNVHVAVLILHIEGFRALQHLLHARLAQEFDKCLVFRQTAMGAE